MTIRRRASPRPPAKARKVLQQKTTIGITLVLDFSQVAGALAFALAMISRFILTVAAVIAAVVLEKAAHDVHLERGTMERSMTANNALGK